MAVSDYAKKAAFELILQSFGQSRPNTNLGPTSELRHLIATPMSFTHATFMQTLESAQALRIGEPDGLSDADMDALATNFPGASRAQGTRSTVVMRVFLREAKAISFSVLPYFVTANGQSFVPIEPMSFQASDVLQQEDGRLYVDVPAVSVGVGESSSVAQGQVNTFQQLDRRIVDSVINIADSTGGQPRESNAEFLERIAQERSEGGLTKVGGLTAWLNRRWTEVAQVKIVTSGDPMMLRDEIWTSDGVNPTRAKTGQPFAAHQSMGNLDFDSSPGRFIASSFTLTSDMIGRRVKVDGDVEPFRLLVQVVSSTIGILSGDELSGTKAGTLWSDGPHTGGMADAYLFVPQLFQRTTVIDSRMFFLLGVSALVGETKLYFTVEPGRSYTKEVPSTGTLVWSEGTLDELVFEVTGKGSDSAGSFLTIADALTQALPAGGRLSYYDMESVPIEAGDVWRSLPVLHITQIEQLDPLSLEPIAIIPASSSGPYAEPGWYVSTPDPGVLFSSRETKALILDNKKDELAFKARTLTGCSITGSSRVTGELDVITRTGGDFRQCEGREVVLNIAERTLTQVGGTYTTFVSKTTTQLVVGGSPAPDWEWFSEDLWRTQSGSITFNGTFGAFTLEMPDIQIKQNIIERIDGGTLPGLVGDYTSVVVVLTPISRPAQVVETVILRGNINEAQVYVEGGIKHVRGGAATNPLSNTGNSVVFPDATGKFDRYPIRVTYATHPVFSSAQNDLDQSGGAQQIARDVLVRSMFPSLIDATIYYSGSSTARQIRSSFVRLLSRAARENEDGTTLSLSLSNIIAELDEDGLSDSIDPNIEIRVTNILSDGEKQVRYLRPSSTTRVTMALGEAASVGATRLKVRRGKSAAIPPGRGRIVLGGEDPDRQEILPYEAIIDLGGGMYEIVIRGTVSTAFEHYNWESVQLCVRDFDPALEFTSDEIEIPANNRPYPRNIVVLKRS